MAYVRDVAKYFISLSEESTPQAITPLKLQKLIYYAQGFHLNNHGDTLFNEHILAWAHGPVVPIIYRDYKESGYYTITSKPFDNSDHLLLESEIETINYVWENFGHLDGKTLEELTHQEDPWLDTELNDVIDIQLIEDYFNHHY